jgi:hypothetical protein
VPADLPDPIAIAVALCQPRRRALAVAGAGQPRHLELISRSAAPGSSCAGPRRGSADHLAQEIGVDTLIKALVRAHRWRRRIESGQAKSITDLAEQEGDTDAWLLPLTCLAPDVVEAVLDGRQPKRLRLPESAGEWAGPRDCVAPAGSLCGRSLSPLLVAVCSCWWRPPAHHRCVDRQARQQDLHPPKDSFFHDLFSFPIGVV